MAAEVRYWDKASWAEFFRQEVLPLYESALTIARLWSELRERAHGRLLSEIIREAPSLELAFAGGTSPPGRYEEDSLASAYKELLGASVNLREYYFLKRLGKEPRTLCAVEKTLPVSYAERVSVLLERALTHAGELGLITQSELQSARESSARAAKEVLERPELASEKFVDFLNNSLGLIVNYNDYVRFIWHLRKIPKKYMYELYPETKKPEVLSFLQQLLGIDIFTTPAVEDPEIAGLYTIFSYDYAVCIDQAGVDGVEFHYRPECYFCSIHCPQRLPAVYEGYKTIGGCLCRVNELVWGLFEHHGELLKRVTSGKAPRPLGEWRSMVGDPPVGKGRVCRDPPGSYEELSVLDESIHAVLVGRAELLKERGYLLLTGRW